MRQHPEDVLIMTLPEGRWVHVHILEMVMWIPKGRQRDTYRLYLQQRHNTPNGALRAVCRHLLAHGVPETPATPERDGSVPVTTSWDDIPTPVRSAR